MQYHSKAVFSGASMLILAALGAAPVATQAAYAADTTAGTGEGTFSVQEGNEIVVTATKRSVSLQKVPFSINAQSADDIRKTGATTLEDLSRNVAGLSIQNLGPGQSQVAIRGVSAGQIVRDQPGVKEQVGIYLDESVISLSLFTPDLDLFDLSRVETLRGPQGTLFGSGSVGGTIRYITNQPTIGSTDGVVEADVNLIDGGGLGGHLKGAINLPMGDKAAIRAVGYSTRYAGFIDALRPDGSVDKNVNKGWRNGGRFAINFKPSDNFSITPRIVYQKVTVDGFNRQESFNLFANPFLTNPVTLGEDQQFLLLREKFKDETIIADNNIKASFDGIDFTSITSYTHRDILVSRDASALTGSVSVDLGFPTAGVELPSNLLDTTKVKSFTQEARLSSNGDGPFQWVFGGFYANTDRDYTQRLPTPGYDAALDAVEGAGTSASAANGFPADSPYNSDLAYKLKQIAVFSEGSFKLDKLTATVGGRYFDYKEKRTISQGGYFGNVTTNQIDNTSSHGFTPRFLLSYEASNDITVNAQASKGFRLAGVNDPLNVNLCTAQDELIFGGYQSYNNETSWNYEAGIKTRGHGFTFNAAVFYDQIKNLQVTLDAGSCSSRVVFNVPKAHSQGIEFELSARPAQGLDIGVSGSLISSKFDSTVVDGTGAVLGGIRDGNRLPSVPKFQISANARYSFPVMEKAAGFVGGTVQYVGDRYTQPSDQENNPRSFVSGLAYGGATGNGATVLNLNLPAYTVVNMNLGVDFDSGLTLTGYVNNVFNENALLSFDRERGGRARLGFAVNQPRTFGATVRQTF